jgi:hypothetical protein
MSTESIELYSEDHAIESEQFTIAFRSFLNETDEDRFLENKKEIEELFKAIDEPNFVQFAIGPNPNPIAKSHQSPKPVLKILREFGRNGKPVWSGQFGENAISITCHQYTNWNETWPSAEKRLKSLIKCIDKFKIVSSIDYRVTDTFKEKIKDSKDRNLLSKKIFKKSEWIAEKLINYEDPRWDFSIGFFPKKEKETEILERVEARSFIQDDDIMVSISNTHSLRFKKKIHLKDILDEGSAPEKIKEVYSEFHNSNKETIKSILDDSLLSRIGLIK